ncbi:tRNA (N(6)-L-threonylcarbamoyladenosine(37)-C(2))-methylthiotransferase MtaB [Mycoplasmatota bacterium]|nr:tRNA (N(6)-L-threonylcarbamoyladenosine(37)-C(2))-methylthiotransferase MtaB [Mycoplasmatota bacterium]
MMKVAFHTLGCKVNAYETEAIMELFMEKGFEIVDYEEFSDVYIVNSCMVTNSGERKSKQMIRRPISINPNAIIIVMGCLSQLKAKAMLDIPGVKIVLGTKNRHLIIDYLNEYLNNKVPLDKSEKLEKDESFENLEINRFKNHKRAFLKIQDGCNNFCTYCIIPYTRGRIRSKTKDIILEEVKELVANGHIEIVLTGIHTGGYGEDLKDYSFADLLKDLEVIDGLKRIRISSIEITELDEKVLEVIANSHKIVNHLHIPLQSGSEKILKLMNRKYTKKEFLSKIREIRSVFKEVAITTDVIVGFPGETDQDFKEAYDFIKEVNFQELHVFPYSRRQGTPADKMKNQVNGKVKKERVHQLLELSDILKEKYMKSQINKTKSVIIEQEKDGWYFGHSKDYLSVKIKSDIDIIGKEKLVVLNQIDFPNIVATIKK